MEVEFLATEKAADFLGKHTYVDSNHTDMMKGGSNLGKDWTNINTQLKHNLTTPSDGTTALSENHSLSIPRFHVPLSMSTGEVLYAVP